MKSAVFPGSFDPITIGHVDLVKRAIPLFDKIIIAIGVNSSKQFLFSVDQRREMISKIFADEPKVEVEIYEGLTVNYCVRANAGYILRGLRSAADFEYENTIARLNHSLNNKIETVFMSSQPQFVHISSTIVREIHLNKGDVSKFVHPEVLKYFN